MRGLSRAEIDALVRDVIRSEDAASSTRPTSAPTIGPSRVPASRRRWSVGAVLLALWLIWHVVGGHHAAGVSGPASYDEAGLPSQPTSYGDGSYRFWQTQPTNSALPVGYNPCRHIDVEINYFDATPTIRADVERVIAMDNRVSGLHLRYVGASSRRRLDQVDGRILVSFAGSATDRIMTADIAGWGGSAYPDYDPNQMLYFAGGSVTLNVDTYPGQTHDAQLLILAHEFGHALGLAHAPGPELMNADPWPFGLRHYAHGDLTGLALLGRLPCR